MTFTELKEAITSPDKGHYTRSDDQDSGVCRVCGGTGWEEIEEDSSDVYGQGSKSRVVIKCRACNGNHEQRVSEAFSVAAIPDKRSITDFDWNLYNTDVSREKQIVDVFIEHFQEFEEKGFGLYINSRTRGSGKTFLASTIGGELIKRYAARLRFVNASDLLEISKEKSDEGGDPLNDLISCRILIIDDLGQKRTGRDWLTDVLFRIIDKRYLEKKSTIITSNVPLAELDFDDRVVDRMNAMMITVKIPEYCVRAREAYSRKLAILEKFGIS